MGKGPLVSVIVPAHNAERFVGDTLASIQGQTMRDWECVVVDDASSDRTVEVVRRAIAGDDRFRCCRLPFQMGVSSARNWGYLESNRESSFVCFMDSDDRWFADSLERLLGAMERVSGGVGVHGLGEFIGPEGDRIAPGAFQAFGRKRLGLVGGRIRVWPEVAPSCFASLCWSGTVYPPGLLLVRRKGYERAGLFDEALRFSEDWDMVIRLSRLGPIGFLDEEVVQYRRHGTNATGDHLSNARGARQVQLKTFFSRENLPSHQRILRRGWRAWERYRFREKMRMAWGALMERDFRMASRGMAAAPIHAFRSISGYPEIIWI